MSETLGASRNEVPQAAQASRWKLSTRIAVRRAGARHALTLATAWNSTPAPHDGQASWIGLKIDISGLRRLELREPSHRRVLLLQLVAEVRRVQLGEPLPRRAELIAADALRARRQRIAVPGAVVVGLLVDAPADRDLLAHRALVPGRVARADLAAPGDGRDAARLPDLRVDAVSGLGRLVGRLALLVVERVSEVVLVVAEVLG